MSDNGHQRELFTVQAALDYLRSKGLPVSRTTFYRWIDKGEIDVIRPVPNARNMKIERHTLDMLLTPR